MFHSGTIYFEPTGICGGTVGTATTASPGTPAAVESCGAGEVLRFADFEMTELVGNDDLDVSANSLGECRAQCETATVGLGYCSLVTLL